MFVSSTDPDVIRVRTAMRALFLFAAVLTVAYFVTLVARPVGAYNTLLDGWAVDAFEFVMGLFAILRYFDPRWRSANAAMKILPIILGAACISWSFGDVMLTISRLGGTTPSVPSFADVFYVGFFPLCYLSFMSPLRYGRKGSFLSTALDGIVAALSVAALSAAYLFEPVLRATGGGDMSTVVSMAYPVGDFMLLALSLGALTMLPKTYRPLFALATIAMVLNVVGDMFNLLQTSSRVGYVADAIVWPLSLLVLALAIWVQPVMVDKLSNMRAVHAEHTSAEKRAGYVMAAFGAAAGIAIMVSATRGHIDRSAVALATAAIIASAIRLTVTVREEQNLSAARFRSLIENAADLIVVAEDNFTIAYITPSSQKILGRSPESLLGTSLVENVHPDDSIEFAEQLRNLSQAIDLSALSFECRLRDAHGSWRTLAWTAADLRNDPSLRGFVLNGSDVTEERRAAQDLVAARDAALSASRAKSEFLSTMSHEIRTPMNGVIGLTELLLATELDADQFELASGIKVSAENLLNIIKDILDFSKIEAGRLEVENIAFTVARVADDVGRILTSAAANKNLELLIDVHPDVPTLLLGDAGRLQQVLLNLAANAIKFTSHGEVLVRVSVVDSSREHFELRFEVADTGIGIATEDQQRLFAAFAQADSSTTRKYGGTGLGLAISRQLVELMGGQINLDSVPGEGSRFWFDLPCGRIDAPEEDFGATPLEGRRALVVDDNATQRTILSRQLRAWGIEVVEASSGLDALELAKMAASADREFDFAIVDLQMPGMDGLTVAGRLKADASTATMTLFSMTSSSERLSESEFKSRGFVASLSKPVRQSALYDILVASLSGEEARVLEAIAEVRGETEVTAHARGTILLVEDNKVNQLVGSRVLASLGYRFDIANNGGEAVQAAMLHTYDAILMDCQMPEMDGYEATGHIRRWEGTSRHTPIIAMTAAAMAGDRDKCLRAGMDGYITKPVRREVIASMIQRWVTTSSDSLVDENVAMDDASFMARHGAQEGLDGEQIGLLRSLDGGEGAVLADIISEYLDQSLVYRDALTDALTQGDAPDVERAAHALRGASANVGATTLAALCGELENLSREGDVTGAAQLMEPFDDELVRVCDMLSHLVARV